MQDRYAADIGDFFKLALLRVLQPGRTLGLAWWLFPDERHNDDGRHVAYLQQRGKWRALDPELFDGLTLIVASGNRRVSALQDAGFLPNALFYDSVIPTGDNPAIRRANREAWFEKLRNDLSRCDLVFLDPDNGFETASFSLGAVAAGKCVSLAQLSELSRPGRSLIVYHHQTRRKGGHIEELKYWAERLREAGFVTVDAIRSRPFSARAFFLLNASPDLRERANLFATRWCKWLSWHPDSLLSATNSAIDRMTDPGIFIAGDVVIYDGEAKTTGTPALTKAPKGLPPIPWDDA